MYFFHGQPNLQYGQPNFKVFGRVASCPKKLFLPLGGLIYIWGGGGGGEGG